MFIESKTWGGYPAAETAEVYARIGPSLGKSTVAPPKVKRKKADTDQLSGVVKFYNAEKQFGFIAIKGGSDVFFHLSATEDADTAYFMPGDRIKFELGEDRRGRTCAQNVRLSKQ